MGVAKLTDQNTIVPEVSMRASNASGVICLRDLPEGMTRADPHLQITDNYITGTRLRIRKVREPRSNKWTVSSRKSSRRIRTISLARSSPTLISTRWKPKSSQSTTPMRFARTVIHSSLKGASFP